MSIYDKHNKPVKNSWLKARKAYRATKGFLSKYAWVILLILLVAFYVVMGIKATAEAVSQWHYQDVLVNYEVKTAIAFSDKTIEVVEPVEVVAAVVVQKPKTAPSQDSSVVYAEFDRQASQKLTAAQAELFKKICEAETGMRNVPNSSGASSAYGPCQLLRVHDKRAQNLGYSNRNESLEANIATSIDLFLEQGSTPWNASKHRSNGTGWGD